MIVSCPNCSTTFNLPDELVKPGSKLRCSVCRHVFDAPEPDLPPTLDCEGLSATPPPAEPARRSAPGGGSDLSLDFEDAAPSRSAAPRRAGKGGKKLFAGLLAAVVLGGAGFAAWRYMPQLSDMFHAAPEQQAPVEDLVSLIALRDVRQYAVNNDKAGRISVIEGKAVNGFPDARELIRVEAALYDKDGKVLVSKQQTAGASVSLFQLQVLGEQELEQALSNKISILSANTNVPPGGEVPFMIVFYPPSENAVEYGVKIVEARKPQL